MNLKKRYCRSCKGVHLHIVERDLTGAARLFMGIVTAGFSELISTTKYTCTNCEHVTELMK